MSTVEVIVGTVVRPHGVHGEVVVFPRTDEPERRFASGSKVRVEDTTTTLTVASSRSVQGRQFVSFAELTTRDQAEKARGWVLLSDVDETQAPEREDEFYDRQLIGLRVLRTSGREVGVVKQVLHPGVQDLLVVAVTGATDALIPFVSALVPDVDLAAGTLTLADVGGLVEEPIDAD